MQDYAVAISKNVMRQKEFLKCHPRLNAQRARIKIKMTYAPAALTRQHQRLNVRTHCHFAAPAISFHI
jgi:hypothetical protein